MKTIDLLRFQLHVSKGLVTGLLSDMQDAPFTFPTPNGGNHPTWIAGHLTFAESNLIHHIMLGDPNPLDDWKLLFGRGSEASDDTSRYPALVELLAKWEEVRVNTLKVLDTLSDSDLDKSASNPPPGREEIFGTYGKVVSMVAAHSMMHYGQVADARRAAGRERLST